MLSQSGASCVVVPSCWCSKRKRFVAQGFGGEAASWICLEWSWCVLEGWLYMNEWKTYGEHLKNLHRKQLYICSAEWTKRSQFVAFIGIITLFSVFSRVFMSVYWYYESFFLLVFSVYWKVFLSIWCMYGYYFPFLCSAPTGHVLKLIRQIKQCWSVVTGC